MKAQESKQRGVWRPSPRVEESVLRRIEALFDEYARDATIAARPGHRPRQLALPLTPDAQHIPRGVFPVSPFELCQKFAALCAVHPRTALECAETGEMVIACQAYRTDGRGRHYPVIYVHSEHLDEMDEPTRVARFAALRELARLIATRSGAPHGTPLSRPNCTVRIGAGEYLRTSFFDDPLNRWAMHLGCPPSELALVLRKEWGDLPVTVGALRAVRPMFARETFSLEAAFFERCYQGKPIEDVFGLDKHAVLSWARHNRVVEA